MDISNSQYNQYSLVCEMFDSLKLITKFDFNKTFEMARIILQCGKVLLTGEGSSRIFPAKNFIYQLRKSSLNDKLNVITEGCEQSLEYDLFDWCVVVSSNSGQTGEAVRLYQKLRQRNHRQNFAITAAKNSLIGDLAKETFVLSCGAEKAVAATKSVIEQALTYISVLHNMKKFVPINPRFSNADIDNDDLELQRQKLPELGKKILDDNYNTNLITQISNASTLYFAGRNNGAAEELALKATEITRKRSIYLEGTFLLHGVEEVMSENDVVVWVEPFEQECKKIDELFVKKHKIPVIAISSFATPFPTIEIPSLNGYDQFLQIFAGWNLLVQAALQLGVNPDKPTRARKIGNEFEH
ncbi:MAG: SIS domain-containing protein [Planctomycetaceae bacterium]|jgi:glucosamine--fructose-6-phosphate aminotransferase (isomerizing)|nr:SIS domain-containing protein [Planctomycetaceae bacterium]